MNDIYFYCVVFFGLILIGIGVAITILSREDPTKHKVPDWITNSIKTMKIIGPVLIGLGVLVWVFAFYVRSKGIHYPAHHGGDNAVSAPKSSFGFKFY